MRSYPLSPEAEAALEEAALLWFPGADEKADREAFKASLLNVAVREFGYAFVRAMGVVRFPLAIDFREPTDEELAADAALWDAARSPDPE